jgi:hypothetical protein
MSQPDVFINGRPITNTYLLPFIPLINRERAEFVRRLRVEAGYSYRAVAEECENTWGIEGIGSQIVGMNFCAVAAEYFDEDWGKEPW